MFETLSRSTIFRNLSASEIENLLENVPYKISEYEKSNIIFLKNDICNSIGFILEGSVEIQKTFASGKVMSLNIFKESNIFGEALIFASNSKFPVNVISHEKSKVLFLDKENILKLMADNVMIMNNFLSLLSNRIIMLNNRISTLSLDTISKKISDFLLKESNRQNSNYITIDLNRDKMAEMLNIPRPSLSRELMNLKNRGIIDYHKNSFKIIDIKELENILLN